MIASTSSIKTLLFMFRRLLHRNNATDIYLHVCDTVSIELHKINSLKCQNLKVQEKNLNSDLKNIKACVLLVHEAACHSGKTSFVAYMCWDEKDPRC